MSLRRIALVVAALVAPAIASAQNTFTFASSLSNPVASGYYVGPYWGTFTSSVGELRSVSVICVDFLNEVQLNDRYQVAVTNLGGPGVTPLSDTRHPTSIDAYRKAAWMSSLFTIAPTNYWGSIQYAIWNVFTPAEAPDDWMSPYVAQAADLAAANDYQAFDYAGIHFDAVDMSRYSLITDVDAAGHAIGGHQEFLTSNAMPTSAVPEPATLVLVGTGLASIGGIVRRRRRMQHDMPSK